MALFSNIIIDLAAGTAILTASAQGNPVDAITYDSATNQVTFGNMSDLTITGAEFLDFTNQLPILQTAILFNFHANVGAFLPFSQMIVNELHEPIQATRNLIISPHTDPNICDYTATLSSLDVYINKRPSDKTIDFPEWMVYLTGIAHYAYSVKNYFNL